MRGFSKMNLKPIGFANRLKNKVFLLLAGLLLTVSVAMPAIAQDSPCDPQYMDALEARAYMEAQREIAQNKNLIYKPDSVLEYTCFDFFLNEAASNFATNRQFSETDRWGGYPTGFDVDTTDIALTQVVLLPLTDYLNNNFNSTGVDVGEYLNNRAIIPPPGQYADLQTSVDGTIAYTCAEMQRVWRSARCENFIPPSEQDYDGFFDFEYHTTTDPRDEFNGWDMECTTPDPRLVAARTTAFNADANAPLPLYDVGAGNEIPAPAGDGAPYLEDDIVTHLGMILPDPACPANLVPTGVQVVRPDLNGGAAYPENVCMNPGCSYTPGGGCTP